MSKKKLKAAILGFGGMGHHHGAEYAKQKDVELVAVCDIDPKRLNGAGVAINLGTSGDTDMSKVRPFLCYEELRKGVPDLDFIDICLPTYLHSKYAIRAMRDGFNVLCEKPMALNSRDCDKMVATQKATGKVLMIAQCLRFSENYEVIRQAVKSGKYGKLLRLDLRRNGNTPPGWFQDHKLSGGAILDLHLHDVDFALSLLGKPRAISAYGFPLVSGGIDDVIAHFHYPRGPLVSIEGSWDRANFSATAVAVFAKGTIEIGGGSVTLRRPDASVTQLKTPGKGSMYFNEIAYFASCVKAGRQPERALPVSTRESVALVEKERLSVRGGGKAVKV